MPDVMSTGLSGLLAFQRALDTTSHNIANANTPGYVRQRAEFGTRPPQSFGNGWVGNGVDVSTVRRQYDEFLVSQSRSSSSNASSLETFASLAERVNNLFSDSETGLGASLQKMQNAVQGVATEPTSIAARQVLLGEARGTIDRLQFFDARMRDLDLETSTRIGIEVSEINSLAAGIAKLNGEIAGGYAATGQPPNDLLDERDRLLDRLAERINVNVVEQDGAVVNVFVGNGQALVLNTSSNRFGTAPDPFDATRQRITLTGAQGNTDVSSALSGGSLGGLLDFRAEVLDPTRNALGRIATGMADSLNSQHRRGQDLTGTLGTDLFAVGAATAAAHSGNAGVAAVAVTRSDVAALTGADYQLDFSAGSWILRRTDTGATVPMAGTGSVADPLRADGLSLVVSGAPSAGDRYLIRPSRESVQGLGLLINDPSRVAVAAPIRTENIASNSGAATISPGEVVDPANAQLRSTVDIQFLTPTTYSVNGAGNFAYTSGAPITINGWSVQIDGVPATGDQFRVSDNAAGRGDNRNALAMSAAFSRPLFDASTTSISTAVTSMTSDVGTRTQRAQLNRDAQSLMYSEAVELRENANGVNLDEEAANMLRFQQAYQASAQLIRIAGEMFDTLINATR
jgi:flagellar hook-associated protein 1 FlgK